MKLFTVAVLGLLVSLSPLAATIGGTAAVADLAAALPASQPNPAPTSLSWRSVTASTNWSFNAIQSQFGPGGAFEGYRHATKAEVWAYVIGAGYDPLASQEANAGTVYSLMGFFGSTHASSAGQFNAWTLGFTADGGRVDIRYSMPNLYDASTYQGSVYETAYPLHDLSSSMIGHYLVAVPEPATMAAILGAVALAGVVIARRRK